VIALLSQSLAEIASPAFGGRTWEVLASATERVAVRATAEQALDLVSGAFAELAIRHAIPARAVSDVQVVLDELLSNVRRHAAGLGRPVDVTVTFVVAPGRLRIEVRDDGNAFDPLALPSPATDAALEARPIGGLGVHFVKTLTDAQAYERTEGYNRLRLTKRF
jgi:anti-sigma regulatory factor (Ser/Thr protein kinase)